MYKTFPISTEEYELIKHVLFHTIKNVYTAVSPSQLLLSFLIFYSFTDLRMTRIHQSVDNVVWYRPISHLRVLHVCR